MALTSQRGGQVAQLETKSLKSTHLPDPPPLTPTLRQYGLNARTLRKINEAYTKRAQELRDTAAAAIAQASTALSSFPRSSSDEKVTAIFTQFYLRSLHKWIRDMEATVSSRGSWWKMEGRRPFNHDYVPLLEHFFDENPLPSHAEKAFLAKKSGMTYKQIHVWFQNRRSRTKREGRTRKKCSAHDATLPMDSSCTRMKRCTVEKDRPASLAKVHTPSSGYAVVPRASAGDKLLDAPTPPHAFPTPYPPSCSYDAFPADLGTFPSHCWLRSRSTMIRTTTVDVDALAGLFSQLNIKDSHGGTPQISRRHELSLPGLAFTTRPLSAPLPSFVSSEPRLPPKRYPLLPVIRAPHWRRRVFKSPGPKALPLTLVPLATAEKGKTAKNVTSRCNFAPLPRRTPRSLTSTLRSVSPLSDTSAFSSGSSLRSISSGSDVCQCEAMHSTADLPRPHLYTVSVH